MVKEKDPLSAYFVPKLSPVRTDPEKPIISLTVPANITSKLPRETNEYTALGFLDAIRKPDGSVKVTCNYKSFLQCIDTFTAINAIVTDAKSNIRSVLGRHKVEDKNPNIPWEIIVQVVPDLEKCIHAKISENKDERITYNNETLRFTEENFEALSALVQAFFSGDIVDTAGG